MTTHLPPWRRPTRNETTMPISVAAARAEALFASTLPAGTYPPAEVAAAIRAAVRAHHGVAGCAADMAAAFGDHPEGAADRMRWCCATVAAAYRRGGAPLAVAA